MFSSALCEILQKILEKFVVQNHELFTAFRSELVTERAALYVCCMHAYVVALTAFIFFIDGTKILCIHPGGANCNP